MPELKAGHDFFVDLAVLRPVDADMESHLAARNELQAVVNPDLLVVADFPLRQARKHLEEVEIGADWRMRNMPESLVRSSVPCGTSYSARSMRIWKATSRGATNCKPL